MQRAAKLGVAPSTLNRVLTGASGVSPQMVLRLSNYLGRSPEGWLAMQYSHDLWRARQKVDLSRVAKARLTAACCAETQLFTRQSHAESSPSLSD